MAENGPQDAPKPVECPPAWDPAVRMLILAGMLLGLGIYCYIDGYVKQKYPHVAYGEDINAWAKWAFNAYGPFVLIPPGLVVLGFLARYLLRKTRADGEGLRHGSKKAAWGEISALDATDLKSKGIIRVEYGDGNIITLDSWKLRNFRELVAFIETKIPAEKHKT